MMVTITKPFCTNQGNGLSSRLRVRWEAGQKVRGEDLVAALCRGKTGAL